MKTFILNSFLLGIFVALWTAKETVSDYPCSARSFYNRSVVCVCNATYCDDITRVEPARGQFIMYMSSEAGHRFKKSTNSLSKISKTSNVSSDEITLKLLPNMRNQVIEGFGAAITDSAALNWLSMCNGMLKQYLIDSYFSDRGLQYNMLRVPIGGSDFSTHQYAYNELPKDDTLLSNFSLSHEDIFYKIPMIEAIFAASCSRVHILATTWSPPAWMKEKTNYSVCGRLKPKYYRTYADYHYKFLEEYDRRGIPVWGITTTNEPANGFMPIKKFNCLGWSAYRMGLWIANHLGPKIRSSKFRNIKILAADDQRFTIPLWFSEMVEEHPIALQYIDGVAVHYYANTFAPPEIMSLISKVHPDKFIIATEACEGAFPWEYPKVDLGSWERAETYIFDIIIDLNYNLTGWIDWNICLNEQGGPTWKRNYVDSPVIVAAGKREFYKQPMFYAMGHFSKFIPRGSVRIDVEEVGLSTVSSSVKHVAFLTPKGTIVVVLYNVDKDNITVKLQLNGEQAVVEMKGKSIATVELLLYGP